MRKGAAARELARGHFARFVITGFSLVPRSQYLDSFLVKRLPKGVYFWYKRWVCAGGSQDSFGRPCRGQFLLFRFLDDPDTLKISLDGDHHTEVPTARRGSWCLQRHKGDIDQVILRILLRRGTRV